MNARIGACASAAVVACAGIFAGCHEKRVRVEERHVERADVIVEEPPPPDAVVVEEAPPPIIIERRPPPPNAGVVWIGGYWYHDHGRYVWHGGRYVRPVAGRRYAPARWEHTRRGWRFHEGGWVRHR